eukprot:3377735-Amphidinium_carterae.1
MDVEQLLPYISSTSTIMHKDEYKMAWRKQTSGQCGAHYFCVIDHNMGYGPQPGSLFPVLDSHPSVLSCRHARLALPSELLGAQGLDTHEKLSGGRPQSAVSRILLEETDKSVKRFAGNAIHVPSCAVFFCSSWVIANVWSSVCDKARQSLKPKTESHIQSH